jgi:hypothetical protein
VDPRGRAYAPCSSGAYPGYPGPSARQISFRRTVLVVVLLSLVALVAGCLGRSSGQAPVPLQLGWAFSPARSR